MRDSLDELGVVLRDVLERHLVSLGEDWWVRGVTSALSFQQRRTVEQRGFNSLRDLDLAALLRVLDGNWELLRDVLGLEPEVRNWIKEAVSIRNRDAHRAPDEALDELRVHRDLDTLARLAAALDPLATQAVSLNRKVQESYRGLSEPVVAPAREARPGEYLPGALVRLIARPAVTGAVIAVDNDSKEPRVTVFHDGEAGTYFASQIELLPDRGDEAISARELRCLVTSTLLRNPTSEHLYSFNSGRVEYEPYQFRPVMKIISADRPRILIADDVGVGKTIEAGLILKELQARQPIESVLVVCPKQLVVEHKWRQELKRFDEDFVELDGPTLRHCIDEMRLEGVWPRRYQKAILPYSLLDESLLLGSGHGRTLRHGLASLEPPAKFDLIIVDEAHHVRNVDTWRHRVVRHLIDAAEAAVLISATPIQTGSDDLFNLLRLLRPDMINSAADFEAMREPNGHISRAEQAARLGHEGWPGDAQAALESAMSTKWGSAVMTADPAAEHARRLLHCAWDDQDARVDAVRALQKLNTFSRLINRTRRRDIGDFTVRQSETVEVSFSAGQRQVHEQLMDLSARIVAMTTPGMPIAFLLSMLRRQASSCINGLAPFIDDLLERRLHLEESSESDLQDKDFDADVIDQIRDEIQELARSAAQLDEDPKLRAFRRIVREKQGFDNNKLLVFSTFRHTLGYLHAHLLRDGVRVGLVHGDVPDSERREIRGRFALDKSDPAALDLLLSSEVGTEGLDNQFCDALVNYDIPWNPMRIEQRIGRIDRRGQRSEAISIKNMIVEGTVDAEIYHRCLQRIGIFQSSLGASEEILGELTQQIRAIADDFTLTAEQRAQKLQQLADNKLVRIREQSELEEQEAALFGLAIQKLDDEGVAAVVSPWLATRELGFLVASYLSSRGIGNADSMFARDIAVLRPTQEQRAMLLSDFRNSTHGETGHVEWRRWLEGARNDSRRLTFNPALADSDVDLLSVSHPLVRLAAEVQSPDRRSRSASLSVVGGPLPPGRYPFAIYGWRTLGLRDTFDVRVISTATEDADALQRAIILAGDGGPTLDEAESQALEEIHYEAWSRARAEHIEDSRIYTEAQLGSITLSHEARINVLHDQLADASHENIRRMREAELRAADADFERRRKELMSAGERCDVTTSEVVRGVLEVLAETG